MKRPLCLIRPQPGWDASARAAHDLGLAVIGEPLFYAEPVAWEPPTATFDGLLIGSSRVFDLAGPALHGFAHLPVYAVGGATAEAARQNGYSVARTGAGGLQSLLDSLADAPLRLLRLGGTERIALAPPRGLDVAERAVYRMRTRPISPELQDALTACRPVVALHSAAAAQHFASECARLLIDRQLLVMLALASRAAEAAGPGWRAIHCADQPCDAALLAKALQLCKDPAGGING